MGQSLHPWCRNARYKIGVTKGTAADLRIIADAWGCTEAEVIWIVVATWVSDHRDRDVLQLPYLYTSNLLLRKPDKFWKKWERFLRWDAERREKWKEFLEWDAMPYDDEEEEGGNCTATPSESERPLSGHSMPPAPTPT